jgi:hypothetical protein
MHDQILQNDPQSAAEGIRATLLDAADVVMQERVFPLVN